MTDYSDFITNLTRAKHHINDAAKQMTAAWNRAQHDQDPTYVHFIMDGVDEAWNALRRIEKESRPPHVTGN
ncbi:hypothetical protein QP905_02615 [Corynebacterium pseudodiphtheriticum]|uniref:hypothetical protein n=1 Tax=Corynebacterium pseudodiphtheriticum TaxID=37637 RepID=UPI002550E1F3|nr:hypothetical protein [Corynebacterium pseudodiphtheriticum]MDK8577237.1 hypothetical protein [Corynebacterium pseudodiphtheriticum]